MTDGNFLNRSIVTCRKCSRLIRHCQKTGQEKRRAFLDWDYWARPVPNFGESVGQMLIVGLAPAAHGANRTGRMFTGDRSGDWLYRALHRHGFANQAESIDREDGLLLSDCVITAVCHCAPPDNKPTPEERQSCEEWLNLTWAHVNPRVVVALGQIAWTAIFAYLKRTNQYNGKRPTFGHGEIAWIDSRCCVLASYHPSQQNTFTGRLTESMFDAVFAKAKTLLEATKEDA